MKLHAGWQFPDADQFMVHELGCDGTYQIAHLEAALKHVRVHGCAVDGGAHVGTWSKVMSQWFDRVIAVEPSSDTFECLQANMAAYGCANVICRNIAIGNAPGTVAMALDAENAARQNTGARFATAGGAIPVETIDSWHLDDLGFLKLDIEGSEFVALQGARETLKRCKPVILYEAKRLWTRHFGLPKDAVSSFLTAHGYRMVEKISCDEIWTHGGRQ